MNHLLTYTLRLSDNSLILAQRISEWTGHGPFLEEDLALTNITLDTFGTANSLYEYAAQIDGKGKTADDYAFFRGERDFTNVLMVEQSNGDYAKTIVRQFLMDVYNFHVYSQLAKSKDETIAGIAQKAIKEVTYHIRHSGNWLIRFGDGTEESHQKAQDAINDLWRFTGELFEMDETDAELLKKGIAADLTAVKANWEKQVAETFAKATLKMPEGIFMRTGGRKGFHTENLGYILAEMQSLPRSLPSASW